MAKLFIWKAQCLVKGVGDTPVIGKPRNLVLPSQFAL